MKSEFQTENGGKIMANYLLYGNKMIEDDSTLEKFAQCVIDGVPEDDLEDIKQRYNVVDDDTEYEDEYMQRVRDILYDDISRTDIDYSELMERFAPELGNLLYDMENHGYDLSALRLTFFGEKVGECFNKLVEEKIWFMKFYS